MTDLNPMQSMGSSGTTTPRPDPTVLTTEQLMREIARTEAIINLQIAALDERLTAETHLTMERFAANLTERDSLKTLVMDKVEFAASERQGIRDLFEQKFTGVTEERNALREMLNERYATQTKALDAAFLAQQAAVRTSFEASEKAMAAALLAAKEAVEKANVATEKRFDGVNELLGQQNGTLLSLLPRAEAEARMAALDARVTDMKSTIDQGFSNANGMRHGANTVTTNYYALTAIAVSFLVGLITLYHLTTSTR